MDDARSTVSNVSETDRILFTVLTNPDRVDLSSLPRVAMSSEPLQFGALPSIEEDRTPRIIEEDPPESNARDTANPHPMFGILDPPDTTSKHDDSNRPSNDMSAPDPPLRSPSPLPQSMQDASLQEPTIPNPPPAPATGSAEDDELTRRTLICDLRKLEMQGVKLTKEFTTEDRTEDMLLELRKHALAMDETANCAMMRDGLRMAVTGLELVNNRIGLLDLDGWSSDVCRDLKKYDTQLNSIYRKWWRRSSSTSPELDICLSLAGSMGLHHMRRKMSQSLMSSATRGFGQPPPPSRNGFTRRSQRRRGDTPPSSDDEAPPEMR